MLGSTISKYRKIGGVLLLLVGSIPFILWGLLATSFGSSVASSMASSFIPGSMSWEQLLINPLRGRITVKHYEAVSPKGEKVIALSSFMLQVSLFDLLRGKLHITESTLENPYVCVHIDTTGAVSIAQTFTSSVDTSTKHLPFDPDSFLVHGIFPLEVDTLSITQGEFLFLHDALSMKITTTPFDIGASANLKTLTYALSLNSSHVLVDLPAYGNEFDSVTLIGAGTLDTTTISQLFIANSTDTLMFKGKGSDLLFPLKMKAAASLYSSLSVASTEASVRQKRWGIGRVQLEVETNDKICDPTIAFSVGYSGKSKYHLPFSSAKVRAHIKQRKGVIDTLRVTQRQGGGVEGSVTFNLQSLFPKNFFQGFQRKGLDSLAYSIDLTTHDLIYPDTSDPVISSVQGRINGEGIGVTPQKAVASLHLTLKGKSRMNQYMTPLFIEGGVAIKEGIITSKSLSLGTHKDNSATLLGEVNILQNSLATTILFDAFNLTPLTTAVNINGGGTLSGKVIASGALYAPSLQTNLRFDSLWYRTYTLDSLLVTASTVSDKGYVSATVKGGGELGKLRAQGQSALFEKRTLKLAQNPSYELSLELNEVSITPFIPSIAGELSLLASYRGTLDQGAGTAKLSLLDLTTPWVDGEYQLHASFDDSTVTIDTSYFTFVDQKSLGVTGFYHFNGSYGISLSSDTFALANSKQVSGFKGRGLVVIAGEGKGTLTHPQGRITLGITDIAVDSLVMDTSLNLVVDLQGDSLFSTAQGIIDFKGGLNTKTIAYQANMTLDSFNLTPLLPQVGTSYIEGITSLSAVVEGTAAKLHNAQLTIPLFSITNDSTSLIEADTVHIALQEGVLLLDTVSFSLLDSGSLQVRGRAPLDSSEMEVALAGSIPLYLIEHFSDGIADPQGSIDIATEIKGTLLQPTYEGTITFDSLAFQINSLDQKIHDLHGAIKLAGNHLFIDTIEGALDKGSFSLRGSVFGGKKGNVVDSVAVDVMLHKLKLELPSVGDIELDGQVTLDKRPHNRPVLKGVIELLDGNITKDFSFAPQASGSMKHTEIQSLRDDTTSRDTDSTSLLFKIKLLPRGAIVVDNNLMFMKVTPDLQLVGDWYHPALEGRAVVKDGEITYLQKVFVIEKGVIDFTNPYTIQSDLDIVAESDIDQYKITLRIEGNPQENLRVTLSSEPVLSDDDILSLMIFGKIGKDLSNNGIRATTLFLNQLINAALDNSAIPIDKLAMDIADGGGFKLTLGEEISRKLSAEFSFDTREEQISQRVDLKYKFFENVSLGGYTTTKGDAGVDLEVQFEHR